MAEQEEIFLPMMLEALYHFNRHLTVEVAERIFEMLKYRRANGLTEDQVAELFPDLVTEEHNYRCYVNRMVKELEQLFDLTPPIIHKRLQQQLNKAIKGMESNVAKKNISNILKASNQYISERVEHPEGGLITILTKRDKAEKMDLQILSTSFFDEYTAVINSMLYYFKNEASPFLNHSEGYKKKNTDSPTADSLFWGPPLKPFLLNWKRFIEVCTEYSKIPVRLDGKDKTLTKQIDDRYKDVPIIKCVDKANNKFRWIGSGENRLPLLGQFITRLEHEDVQILRPEIEKKQLAEMFIKFFDLEEKYPESHYLTTQIFRDTRKNLNIFSDIVR